ncbi:MAG TPA: LacI family DNA-binding transcriptional regulator [Terrimicrobiaceae bacterium]
MTRPRKKEITINDIAAECGVSYQTVSRAINGMGDISKETRSRVLKVAERLGYRPNMAARSLVSRQSSVLGMISRDVGLYGSTQVMVSVAKAARTAGYGLMFGELEEENVDAIQRAVNELCAHRVAGILMFQVDADVRALRDSFRNAPFVGLNSDFGYEAPSVLVDQEGASEMATNHLIDLGHSEIAHISGPDGYFVAQRRHQGWLNALARARLTPGPLVKGDFSARSGFEAANALLENHKGRFTAVVAANDQMALGAIRAFEESGFRVPDDVSVVGFDDTPEAEFFRPPLSTVKHDFSRLGQLGVQCLLAQLSGLSSFPKLHIIKPTFVQRLSTGAPTSRPHEIDPPAA